MHLSSQGTSKSISVAAPATTSISVGNDFLGVCLNKFQDTITIQCRQTNQYAKSIEAVKIMAITGLNQHVPINAQSNCASVVAYNIIKDYKVETEIGISINKQIPVFRGMGSSSASTVATIIAINELLGLKMTSQKMFKYAIEAKKQVNHSANLGKISACLKGGMTLSLLGINPKIISLPSNIPINLVFIHFPIKEHDKIIAKNTSAANMSLANHANESSLACGLIASLYKNDLQLFRQCLKTNIEHNFLSKLLKDYEELQKIITHNNGFGSHLCKYNKSLLTWTDSLSNAQKLENAIKNFIKQKQLNGVEVQIISVGKSGAQLSNSFHQSWQRA